MNKLLPLLAFSILLLVPVGAQNAFAQDPNTETNISLPQIGGDNPITTSFTHTGNVAVATSTIADNAPQNFNIVLPAGSTVIQALMYTNGFSGGTASGTVNAVNLGPGTAIATDPAAGNSFTTFRWDATAAIPGSGVYPFSFVFGSGASGQRFSALVVVYSNPANPNQQVIINDGSEALANAASTTVFNGVAPGAGTLYTIIAYPDSASVLGEEIRFNGATLAGPGDTFDVLRVEVFNFPVLTVAGANSLDIITGGDLIAWPLAILTAPDGVVGGELLPIDSTALVLAGLQSSAIWMLPVLAGTAGVGAFYIKTRMSKE